MTHSPVNIFYLQKLMYLFSSSCDKVMLFENTLLNFREDEESRARGSSGDEGLVAKFTHKTLDCQHIGFAVLDTTRDALVMSKRALIKKKQKHFEHTSHNFFFYNCINTNSSGFK